MLILYHTPRQAASSVSSKFCFRYGFNDAAHFNREFKERYGMSSKEYRDNESQAIP